MTVCKWWSMLCYILSVCHIELQCLSGIKCLSSVFASTAVELHDNWAIGLEYVCAFGSVCVCVCVCVSVSNIAGRLKPGNTVSLIPAFNYLYCCVSLSSARCTDRGKTLSLFLSWSFYHQMSVTTPSPDITSLTDLDRHLATRNLHIKLDHRVWELHTLHRSTGDKTAFVNNHTVAWLVCWSLQKWETQTNPS